MPLRDRAFAKINLSLHVVARREDGWHLLDSLVMFGGVCDVLTFSEGDELSLTVAGPTAADAGTIDDNLILVAARALAARVAGLRLGQFHLNKQLPVAAGMGGGSADAAAALRLLARANALSATDPRVIEAARATGADVPVCLSPRARVMRGVGHDLGPAAKLAPLPAVLVNPGVPVATAEVFRALGLKPGENGGPPMPAQRWPEDRDGLLAALGALRNDLEPPARALAPQISAVSAALARTDDVRVVRMSGSGATVFGLYAQPRAAARAAAALRRAHPDWWVRATLLR